MRKQSTNQQVEEGVPEVMLGVFADSRPYPAQPEGGAPPLGQLSSEAHLPLAAVNWGGGEVLCVDNFREPAILNWISLQSFRRYSG